MQDIGGFLIKLIKLKFIVVPVNGIFEKNKSKQKKKM